MIGIDWIAEEPVPMTPTRKAGEVDALMRPFAGVIDRPAKILASP